MPSDLITSIDWRTELHKWLDTNPREVPEERRILRQQFLERFPREHISSMTLEDYALGLKDTKDSFCYWLEWRTATLGSVSGGSSAKWGVWWSRENKDWRVNTFFGTPDRAIQIIRTVLNDMFV